MKYRYQINSAGILFIAAAVLIAAAAMNSQNNLMFWVLAVMIAAIIITLIWAAQAMRGVEVRRLDPRHGTVGEPLLVRYEVTNRNRLLPAFNLEIEDLPAAEPDARRGWQRLMPPADAWVLHAGPGETVHGESIFWPHARGPAHFDRISISTTFPFGLLRRTTTRTQRQHTLIYPRLYELQPRVLDRISPTGFSGVRMSQQTGLGDEYFGMREYRVGDPIRYVSWKRTAGRGELVLIEKTQPNPPRLRVVLDLTQPTEALQSKAATYSEKLELEERAISLAASLVRAADIGGFEFGLSIMGVDAADVPLRRGQWHLHKIMAALASIDLAVPRLRPGRVADTERAGLVMIAPDRVRPIEGAPAAWYLTAGQLDTLAVRPIGWRPPADGSAPPADAPQPHRAEAAA